MWFDEDRIMHITPLKEGEGWIDFYYGNKKVLRVNVTITSDAIQNSDDDFFSVGN